MLKENKKFLIGLGILFLMVILTYPLPHNSYSLSQYILRPIILSNGVISLSGVIPLILFIIGVKYIYQIEKFKMKSFESWIMDYK